MPSWGNSHRAIDVLEIWSKNVGGEQKNWFIEDADLAPIRDHPRYPALLARLDLEPAA